MKTFHEALDIVLPKTKGKPSAEKLSSIFEHMHERMGRIRPLHDELMEDAELSVLLEFAQQYSCCPEHARKHIFSLGLQVGMEMERSETGGVRFE